MDVVLQVAAETVDPLTQHGHLDLGRTGVGAVVWWVLISCCFSVVSSDMRGGRPCQCKQSAYLRVGRLRPIRDSAT